EPRSPRAESGDHTSFAHPSRSRGNRRSTFSSIGASRRCVHSGTKSLRTSRAHHEVQSQRGLLMTADRLEQLARRAVVELHAFCVDWFQGTMKDTPDEARCERALASDFRMITPDGQVQDRPGVFSRLRAARGSAGPGFAIKIGELRTIWKNRQAVLL